jgi:hypothetical protein
VGESTVGSGREVFSRSRWRMQQYQDDAAIDAALRHQLGKAGDVDASFETLREALILLEARLEDERARRMAAEAEVAFLAAQLEVQKGAGVTGRLRRLAGR